LDVTAEIGLPVSSPNGDKEFSEKSSNPLNIGDWIVVKYDNKTYPGEGACILDRG